MDRLINVQKLSKNYKGNRALKDLSFDIKRGEILGIIGHNGAGKSTLINSLADIIEIDGGSIDYVFDKKSLYDHIGVQRQENHFEFNAKVYEVCYLYKNVRKSSVDVKELLEEFGLISYENSFIRELSGGNKQMLSILLTLIHEPEIIFLDELTTGLDPLNRRKVWDLLKKINKDKEVSILLTSHSMEEIEYLADRILILHEGEKIFLGGVNEAVRRYSEGEKNIEFTLKDPLQEFKLMKYDGQKLKERRYCIRTRDEEEVITYLYREVGVEALKVENLTLEDIFLKIAGYTLDETGRKRT